MTDVGASASLVRQHHEPRGAAVRSSTASMELCQDTSSEASATEVCPYAELIKTRAYTIALAN